MPAFEWMTREQLGRYHCVKCDAIMKAHPDQQRFKTHAGHILTEEAGP